MYFQGEAVPVKDILVRVVCSEKYHNYVSLSVNISFCTVYIYDFKIEYLENQKRFAEIRKLVLSVVCQ